MIPLSPVHVWLAGKTGLGGNLSPRSLQAYQFARLPALLSRMKTHSRYYAQALKHVDVSTITNTAALAALPFTTSEDLRHDPTAFVCVSQQKVARIITLTTSGTQGQPKRLFFSEQDLELCVDFFAWGIRSLVGPGDTVALFLGGGMPGGTVDLLCQALKRIGASPIPCGIPDDPATWEEVEGVRDATCFIGIPVSMLQMARTKPALRPKSVLLCSDYVPLSIVEAIKASWRCEVFTHYGSTESGLGGGVECCAHDGCHWRDADMLLEIIDPHTGLLVPPGMEGEIVFTTLTREAMPLLRYRTGDIASIREAPCPCGSALPRLGRVLGRYTNEVRLTDGSSISIHQLDEMLFRQPEVLDYAARLLPDHSLEITVRLGCEGPLEAPCRRIAALFPFPVSLLPVAGPIPPQGLKRTLLSV